MPSNFGCIHYGGLSSTEALRRVHIIRVLRKYKFTCRAGIAAGARIQKVLLPQLKPALVGLKWGYREVWHMPTFNPTLNSPVRDP